MCRITLPFHYRFFECRSGKWLFHRASAIYRLNGENCDVDNLEANFGLSRWDVVTQLFRLNGGHDGFYLANLRDREYYYCGLEAEDVPAKIRELGLLVVDPV
jgi:hypothetical protein